MRKPINCNTFCDWIPHFQADEVSADERAELQAHLDQCPRCERRLGLEDAFLGTLKNGMTRTPAPPGLESRIRAGLDAATPAGAKGGWYRMPWVAAVAASLLLAVMLVPWGGDLDSPGAAVAISGRQVLVVDRDCDRAGKTTRPAQGRSRSTSS